MLKRVIALFLSGYFLLASSLLPKGDFSLLADIPSMYQHYTQIDDPKDIGVIDFVVDYLLNAEAILGAENYNGHPVPYNTVQFQHDANFLNYLITYTHIPPVTASVTINTHYVTDERLTPTAYADELLRPPVLS